MTDRPGLVGVIAQETGRYNYFSSALTATVAPPGTLIHWQYGLDIAANTNALVRRMFAADFEWLWIMGDDHTWSPDLLMKLLARDKDIVVPLCLQRAPPYRPVAFTEERDIEVGGEVMSRKRARIDLDQHPFGGVVPIHSAGSAGMLVKREVFENIEAPWFRAGALDGEQLSEDLYFCDRARAAGYEIHCDLDASLGHINTSVVWPVRGEGGWTFGFSMVGGFTLEMPRRMQQYADDVARRADAT